MSVDVILVKFGNDRCWQRTLAAVSGWGNVLTRDNTHDNIGLVRARIELVGRSTAEYLLFMDYDFRQLRVDLRAMCAGYPMAQPGIGRGPEWEQATHHPCNFMLIQRAAYDAAGGLDPDYHTAFADLDLIRRLPLVMQHNRSAVQHIGSATTDHKRETWGRDRDVYRRKCARIS